MLGFPIQRLVGVQAQGVVGFGRFSNLGKGSDVLPYIYRKALLYARNLSDSSSQPLTTFFNFLHSDSLITGPSQWGEDIIYITINPSPLPLSVSAL